jgi:hypothetical protein
MTTTKKNHKKRADEVAQGVGSEFKHYGQESPLNSRDSTGERLFFNAKTALYVEEFTI